jgi:hypothetical protein
VALILGKIKCCFCGRKEGVIVSVCNYGIYGDAGSRIFFHNECIEPILIEPEKFGNSIVDQAINIEDLRKRGMGYNNEIVKIFREKVEKLQRYHFERMFPKGREKNGRTKR